METRANYVLIGAFTLAVIAAAFGFVLWFQSLHTTKQRSPLRVVFEGPASGLRNGGSVNFNGIRIGEVVSVKLDNPRRVVALAMVENKAPIRKDTMVGLEFQGLTGVAAISLKGGEEAAPPVPHVSFTPQLQRIEMALSKKKRVGKKTISASQVRKTASGRKRRKSDGTQPPKAVTPSSTPAQRHKCYLPPSNQWPSTASEHQAHRAVRAMINAGGADHILPVRPNESTNLGLESPTVTRNSQLSGASLADRVDLRRASTDDSAKTRRSDK